jgi:hypothetical protein
MNALKEPERITLAEGLKLLERDIPADQAKARLRQAFIRKAFSQQPLFALPYDEADIDWATGSVKIHRKPDRFCPTFHRADFNTYFFGRDKNLIRKLMLRLEGILRPGETTAIHCRDDLVEGYTPAQINHHLSLLARMGYVDVEPQTTEQKVCDWALKGLTHEGHDFLDRNRDGLEETPLRSVKAQFSRKIFIVHGHDEGSRESVARFLEKIDFEPVILHERANRGRTIIEKFEAHADVGFAVVLMTPDDVGGAREGMQQQARARQNVILELGYFIGRLGRERVCAVKSSELELPSDILGVVWTPFDSHGAWKVALLKELEAAGYEIDWNKAMRP